MKLVKAIVRTTKVDDIKDALDRVGVPGMTVTEVRGHGRQKGHIAIYRGKEYSASLLHRMEVEIVLADERVDEVAQAVAGAARTGEVGDGRVYVIPVERAFNIRTGEEELQ